MRHSAHKQEIGNQFTNCQSCGCVVELFYEPFCLNSAFWHLAKLYYPRQEKNAEGFMILLPEHNSLASGNPKIQLRTKVLLTLKTITQPFLT